MVETVSNLRESRVIDPSDGRSVLIDCTGELRLGLLANTVSRECFENVDGVVVYEDSVIGYLNLFLGREAPSYILRVKHYEPERAGRNWAEELVVQALRTDASALIYLLSIGHEDERLDSSSMSAIAMLSDVCNEYDLPLIAEVAPQGERIKRENYLDCVGLAARMAVEAGASVVAIPFLNDFEAFQAVVNAVKIPTLLIDPQSKYTFLKNRNNTREIIRSVLKAGLSGVILGPSLVRSKDPDKLLADIVSIVHGGIRLENR